MEWTDTALVLRVGRFRETDLWINMLTKDRGLVSAFAFGGSKSRKRFCGCLDLLNVIRVRAKHSRKGPFLNLEEGSLLSGPQRLRTDWTRMGMLMNCVRFLEALGVAPDGAEAAFALMQQLFVLLEEAPDVHAALPTLFRLRLASDQGYVPDFSVCGVCGKRFDTNTGARFQLAEGHVACAACAQSAEGILLRPEVHALLCAIQATPPEAWNQLAREAGQLRECLCLVDDFIQYHLGVVWQNGRFRRV